MALTYPKTSAGDSFNEYGMGPMRHDSAMAAKGGGSSTSGPTGSSRSYPKGSKVSLSNQMNPQKVPCTDIYVGGI